MAGTAITALTPLRNPKVGEKVITESGGVAKVVANTSQSGSTNSCGIKVEYVWCDPPHHLKEGAYSRVFRYRLKLVPVAKDLAKKQENENRAAVLWALGLYRARAYVKKIDSNIQIEAPSFDAELGTVTDPPLPAWCDNLAADCPPRHKEIMLCCS